eukprot:scaffold19197_cov40-Cyclotella_meneghiniana.AAC.2
MLDLPDPSANPCASNDYNTDPSNPCPELTTNEQQQSSQPTEQPSTQFLSCIATSANELLFNHGASATVFEFDYELHTPLQQSGDSSGSSVDSAISEFQNGLAGSIAADYGVYCNHLNDGKKKKRRSSRELGKVVWEDDGWNNVNDDGEEEKYSTEWNGDVYGVSSSPSDVVDDFVSEFYIQYYVIIHHCCLILFLSYNLHKRLTITSLKLTSINLHSIAKCTIETNLQVPTTCTPIKGYLTLYSTPTANNNNHNRRDLSSHPSNTNTILNTIQTYIEKRTHLYTSETILAVSYIGIRSSVGVGLLNPNLLMRPEERKRSSSGGDNRRSLVPSVVGLSHDDVLDYIMGLSVGGVAVGCLLVVLLVFRRANRRHVAARQNLEVMV